MKSCLLCPVMPVKNYFTQFIENHHIQGRARSDWTIPLCTYHHTQVTQNRIPRQLLVDKANEFYGKEIFYLPYEGSKKIKVRENV